MYIETHYKILVKILGLVLESYRYCNKPMKQPMQETLKTDYLGLDLTNDFVFQFKHLKNENKSSYLVGLLYHTNM